MDAGASTLDKGDVEKMVKEAEKFAAEDKKRREGVETKNQAETMVYQTEKQLKEFEGKVRPLAQRMDGGWACSGGVSTPCSPGLSSCVP